jgi:hypothetical protein
MLTSEQKRAALAGPCIALRFLVRPECRPQARQQMEGISDAAIFHRWMDLLWTFRETEAVSLLTQEEKHCLEEFNAVYESLPWQPLKNHPHISEVSDDDLAKLLPSVIRLLSSLEKRIQSVGGGKQNP